MTISTCLLERLQELLLDIPSSMQLRDMPREPTSSLPCTVPRTSGVSDLLHWDLGEVHTMAITATQGVMAVGLLSVLFGGDLLTLLGSKVHAREEPFISSQHICISAFMMTYVLCMQSPKSSATQGPLSDRLSEGGKVHISFCSS